MLPALYMVLVYGISEFNCRTVPHNGCAVVQDDKVQE
jgi:hypothetical protein